MRPILPEESVPSSEFRPIQAQSITENNFLSRQTIAGTIDVQFKEQWLLVHCNRPNDSSAGEEPPEETFSARIVFTPASHMGLSSQVILEISQALTKGNNILSTRILSFRSIVPNTSEIFCIVQYGSIENLQKAINEGTASLTDCDPDGRSLLNVGINLLIQLYESMT